MGRGVPIEGRWTSRGTVRLGDAREVRNLVPRVSRLAQEGIGELILGSLIVRIGGRQLSPGHLRPHLRPLLDNKRVGADMVGLVRQGSTQGCCPVRQALPGGSVDKIHRGRQARFLRPLHDEGNPLGRMRAIQGREDLRHGRLHAERHSSKPSVSQLRESITRHRVGVSLEGHLRARRNTDAFTQAHEDLGQLIDIQYRRSTATEKHRPRLARGEPGLGHDP